MGDGFPRPPGFVHVDLDGLWTLAACYGFDEESPDQSDPVFEFGLRRMLDLFDRMSIKATFFIVARDLEHPERSRGVIEILSRGHELGNHTYNHVIGLESLPYAEILHEVKTAQVCLTRLAGKAPFGFRAPGYDAGPKTLQACSEAGVRYDGSLLPTRWGWGLRFLAGRLRRQVANGRSAPPGSYSGQYGRSGGASFAPQWFHSEAGGSPLLRLPLAVSPGLRLPIHASLGILLGEARVRRGLRGLAGAGWPMTYLLHGLDVAAPEELRGRLPAALLASRGFRIPLAERLLFLEGVLGEFLRLTQHQLTGRYVCDSLSG